MRLFITGAAGFIGSNYVRHVLNTTDDEITVFDALTYAGHRASLEDLEDHPRFSFVYGDICDRSAVETALPGHQAVVHFAAESHVDRSITDPDAFIRTNCDGTNVLCDVARKADVERFVHISTDEVYGSIERGSSSETDVLNPRSPYSASKAGSDLIALSHHITHGLPVSVTRSSNNYGPYQFPEKIIPLFATNLLDRIKVPVYGDGKNIRDWCHVADNCTAVDLVLRRGEIGEIYNIGAGSELTNLELTHALLELMGFDESMITWVDDRLGHDRRYSVDISKITALGWTQQHNFAEGLADTVRWYADHRDWWEPLKARA
ncbi:MAG TPA: dTDP-glucose 4,6-dehydratase [Acidimicrobiia bacterium]|jgi:dTDP-glucose 4,6-dehydratase|nr:dTDP-glucose 4,6-dehydratase [Acidimicrobiia bacterium]